MRQELGRDRPPQALFAPIRRQERDLGDREIPIARDEVEALVRQRNGDARDPPAIDEEVVGRGREAALVDPAPHGGVALGVEIDEEHAPARGRERGRKIHAGGRLADAPFLVGDRDDPAHGPSGCVWRLRF